MEDALGLGHRAPQFLQEFAPRDIAALREFFVPVAKVTGASDAGNNPLPDIPREMEDHVPYAVRRGVGPPPHFAVREQTEATRNPRQMESGERMSRMAQEGFGNVVIHGDLTRPGVVRWK